MKIEPVYFQARVELPDGHWAGLVVETYSTDPSRKFTAYEFRLIAQRLDSSWEQASPAQQRSRIRESLRVSGHAEDTVEGSRDNDEKHIRQKLLDVYGRSATITLKRQDLLAG